MAVQLVLRKGTDAENNSFTGADAEVTVDVTNKTLRVHDGTTTGGFQTASVTGSQTLENKTFASPEFTGQITGDLIPSDDITYDLGSSSNRWRDLFLSGNTIDIGGATISVTNGSFEFKDSGGNDAEVSLAANTTDDLSEGTTNLYFTTARVDAHLSGGNAIDYNSGTISIASNAIGTDELNVTGTGSAGEALLSDGDGSFSFGAAGATITDDTSTNSDFYPTLTDSTSGSFTAATVSSTKLFFNPSSGTLNATAFNSLSDERTKKNIETLDSALDKTLALRGVSYTFKDSGVNSIGLIAQELEQVIPEVVSTGDDGLKSVSYGNLVGLLVEAIKDQQEQIDELKNKLYK